MRICFVRQEELLKYHLQAPLFCEQTIVRFMFLRHEQVLLNMPRGRPRKIVDSSIDSSLEETIEELPEEELIEEQPLSVFSEKQKLLALYQELKNLKVNRISELEGLIARAE